ncbi:hypothetical protein DFAR_800002 [Desulfarculales bacterium]
MSKPNRRRGFIKIGRQQSRAPREGQGKRHPRFMIFLTQAATKSTMATKWQGVIPVSRGQGCSATLGPFLIPGSTSKVQDNGIKIPNWSSQSEKIPYFPGGRDW